MYKVKGKGAHLFLFCDWGSKEVPPFGSAQCSKRFVDGPMDMALSKKKTTKQEKKSYERTHDLINMNHTTITQLI